MKDFENSYRPEEEGNDRDFFTWDEAEVTRKYGKTIAEREATSNVKYPLRRAKDSLDFDTNGIRREAEDRFERLLAQNNGAVPEEVYFKAVELVDQYKALNLKHSEQYDNAVGALKFSQLEALLRNPDFVKNPRSVVVFEKLADLEGRNLPLSFEMFEDYKDDGDYSGHYELRPGFDVAHLETFEHLIDSPRLWAMPEKRILFASVASAIEKLSRRNPTATLPLRIKLLENCMAYGQDSEIYRHLVYTFNNPVDRKALTELVENNSDPKLSKIATKILSGGFEGTLWS